MGRRWERQKGQHFLENETGVEREEWCVLDTQTSGSRIPIFNRHSNRVFLGLKEINSTTTKNIFLIASWSFVNISQLNGLCEPKNTWEFHELGL